MLVGIAQLKAKTWHKFEYDAGIDNREVIFAGRVQIIHLPIAKPRSESMKRHLLLAQFSCCAGQNLHDPGF
jgi:hypothetical protein